MTVRTMAFSVRLRYATVRLVANGAQTCTQYTHTNIKTFQITADIGPFTRAVDTTFFRLTFQYQYSANTLVIPQYREKKIVRWLIPKRKNCFCVMLDITWMKFCPKVIRNLHPVFLYCRKRFFANNMFNFTGIFCSGLFIHSQPHE